MRSARNPHSAQTSVLQEDSCNHHRTPRKHTFRRAKKEARKEAGGENRQKAVEVGEKGTKGEAGGEKGARTGGDRSAFS